MPNSLISQIKVPSGTTYDIKDAWARQQIEALGNYAVFIGVTTTALTDGATTNPIKINGEDVTAKTGDIVTYGSTEFIWNGSAWQAFGDLSALGDFAWADEGSVTVTPHGTVSQPTFSGSSSAVTITATDNTSGNYQPKGTVSKPTFSGSSSTFTGTFTPAGTVAVDVTEISSAHVSVDTSANSDYTPTGTVSKPTFTGSATTSTGKFTPAGSVSLTNSNQSTTVSKASSGTATYTPEGTVAAPTISVATAGSTTTIKNPTSVTVAKTIATAAPGATAPANAVTWYAVSGETLSLYQLGYTTGASITTSNVTVKNGDAAYTASAPAFTGTGARLVTGNISVPSSASFTGTEGNVSVSGTPSGTVSQPTFTGDGVDMTYSLHTGYTGTFTGTAGSVSVSGTPNGSVSQPTFTGTKAQLSGTVTPSGTVSQPTFTGTAESWTVEPNLT